MLSVLTTGGVGRNTKRHKETQGGVGYDYYLDGDDGIRGFCIRPNLPNCTLNTCISLYMNYISVKLLYLKRTH